MKINSLYRLFRYDWPLHFVLLATGFLPDNIPFLKLRGRLASPFFGMCGKNLRLGRNIVFYNPSSVHIGDNVYVAFGSWVMAGANIRLDHQVMLGPYCVLVSANHSRQDGSYRFGPAIEAPISIGEGSWLAAHVTVTAGSSIGRGSLIAANSVVSGQIPENSVYGGVPARKIRGQDAE